MNTLQSFWNFFLNTSLLDNTLDVTNEKKKEFFFFYALWIEDTAAAKEIFHAPVVQRTIVYIFWCY